ncbi:hypothetical protein F5B20DRAFT_364865 [Whalleya microplaca]|nr:hypothetical protein F5B20DRAFT_364865 [Whalleya microplaca]
MFVGPSQVDPKTRILRTSNCSASSGDFRAVSMANTNVARTAPRGQQQQEENIPNLSSFSPAIFAPAQMDFTAPPPALPLDQNVRHAQVLTQMDEHAHVIERNIRYLVNQECKRIRQECRQKENQDQRRRKRRPGLEKSEERWLPSSGMELDNIMFQRKYVPMPLKGPYEVPALVTLNDPLLEEVAGLEKKLPRKYAEIMILHLFKTGISQLEGHAGHVQRVKQEKHHQIMSKSSAMAPDVRGVHPADRMDIG